MSDSVNTLGRVNPCLVAAMCGMLILSTWVIDNTAVAAGRDSYLLAKEAIELAEAGDYESAARLFEQAIDKNPGDASKEARRSHNVDDADVEWGESQVEEMLLDRPEMRTHLAEDDRLLSLARDYYAGILFGKRIRWDAEDPLRSLSVFIPPTEESLGAIRIRRTELSMRGQFTPRPFEELWSSFFFEMYNICNSNLSITLNELGRKGEISKSEFIRGKFMAEARSVQEVRGFYVREFLPWASAKKFKSNPRLWYTETWWGTPEECFKRVPPTAYYPWRAYGVHYDEWARTYVKQLSEVPCDELSLLNIERLRNFGYSQPKYTSEILARALQSEYKEVADLARTLIDEFDNASAVAN